jgi:hypothetical protein
VEYPCPDCGKLYLAERWAEHVKRVHFPEQIWVCQEFNPKTGSTCESDPFFRSDNFGDHLKKAHDCSESEIDRLKVIRKSRVIGFFHSRCGFCTAELTSRETSIDHIRDHFKMISRRADKPMDSGISEWKHMYVLSLIFLPNFRL